METDKKAFKTSLVCDIIGATSILPCCCTKKFIRLLSDKNTFNGIGEVFKNHFFLNYPAVQFRSGGPSEGLGGDVVAFSFTFVII